MTPALESLARQLAASPRWRWLPGMRWIRLPSGAPDDGGDCGRLDGYNPEHMACPVDAIPDLSDPLTAAGLLVIAREVSGCPEAVAGRVCGRWMVWATLDAAAQGVAHSDGDPISGEPDNWIGFDTEAEALAAVILGGGE